PVRLLLQRHADQGHRAAGPQSGPWRRRDPPCLEWPPLPLRYLSQPDCCRARRRSAHAGGSMSTLPRDAVLPLTRRELLQAGGALVIGFGFMPALQAQQRRPEAGPPDPQQIDSWIA